MLLCHRVLLVMIFNIERLSLSPVKNASIWHFMSSSKPWVLFLNERKNSFKTFFPRLNLKIFIDGFSDDANIGEQWQILWGMPGNIFKNKPLKPIRPHSFDEHNSQVQLTPNVCSDLPQNPLTLIYLCDLYRLLKVPLTRYKKLSPPEDNIT